MEQRQGTLRGSSRVLGRAASVANARKATAAESRRALLAADASAASLAQPADAASSALGPPSPSSDAPTAVFDALELLGPSLADVLTIVSPPVPKRLQEQQQATGEDLNDEAAASDPTHPPAPTKFDVCLSRSVVLGKVVDTAADNARRTQEYFAKLLDKLQLDATGLVLLQDSTVVVFLETTAEQFLQVLKQLQKQSILDAAAMRILASSDDHAERVLQGLYFKKVAVAGRPGGDNNAELTDDSLRQSVVDTFLDLMKFVRKIGPMAPGEIRKCLTNLSMSDQMCLPSNDLVLALLAREELMTVDEYLEVFASPIAVELEAERVWPLHPLIQY